MSEVELLRDAIERQRGYAEHFDWPHKSVKERGVIHELLSSIERDTGEVFFGLRSRGNEDPPDCEATGETAARVGFEAVELVDATACREGREARKVDQLYWRWADWPPERIVAEVQELIGRKGKARPKGGPYDRYILAIHTGEPALTRVTVAEALAGHVFTDAGIITEAYLLLSYEPESESCPYLRFALAR